MDIWYVAITRFVRKARPLYKRLIKAEANLRPQYELKIFEILGKQLRSKEILDVVAKEPSKIHHIFSAYAWEIETVLSIDDETVYTDPKADINYQKYKSFYISLRSDFGLNIETWWEATQREKKEAELKEVRKNKLVKFGSVVLLACVVGGYYLKQEYQRVSAFESNREQIIAEANEVITEANEYLAQKYLDLIPRFNNDVEVRKLLDDLRMLNEINEFSSNEDFFDSQNSARMNRRAQIPLLCDYAKAYGKLLSSRPTETKIRTNFEYAIQSCEVVESRVNQHLASSYKLISNKLEGEVKQQYEALAKQHKNLAEQASAKEFRKSQVESLFSSWDGSSYSVVNYVKAAMNDPSSFEHVSTRYLDFDDYIQVNMTYRGKNGFGGVVTEGVIAKIDMQGNIISIN